MVFAPAVAAGARPRVPRGYLIAQQVAVYHESRFGAISTGAEADALFDALKGRLDAVEFEPLFYGPEDVKAARAVAESAGRRGIELWSGTFRLTGRIRAFGAIPEKYQAWVMESDGTLAPALDEEKRPLFDVLNPEAVGWFLPLYRAAYIKPMRGVLHGLIFNEDVIPYLAPWKNDRRPDYRRSAVFSPRVLALWQEWCRTHGVVSGGVPVDRFPVHRPELEAAGKGRTRYFPGWDVPERVSPGQRFVDMPRATGVWKAWQEFLAAQFAANWIARLAAAFHEENAGNPLWRGALYFGLHEWSLPYEQIRDRELRVPRTQRWGAWGLQRGLDLEKIAALPEIDALVCETFPPLRANLEGFAAEFARIARAAGKQFGVMLHRDDRWPLGTKDSEKERWALIGRLRPDIIERYPHDSMIPGGAHHSPAQEKLFQSAWLSYRGEKR